MNHPQEIDRRAMLQESIRICRERLRDVISIEGLLGTNKALAYELRVFFEDYIRDTQTALDNLDKPEPVLAYERLPRATGTLIDAIVEYMDGHDLTEMDAWDLAEPLAAAGVRAGNGRILLRALPERSRKSSVTNTLAKSSDPRLRYNKATRKVTRIRNVTS